MALNITTSWHHTVFRTLPKKPWIATKPTICTLQDTRVGGTGRDGEQTLHGDRDLLFCRLNCSRGRDGQRTGCLPFFETLQRNKQAFLLWTESLYISRAQERGDEVIQTAGCREGQSVDVDRIVGDRMNFVLGVIYLNKNNTPLDIRSAHTRRRVSLISWALKPEITLSMVKS